MEIINCPECGTEIKFDCNEFVDVSTDPIYKEKIINGDFFLARCPECGAESLVEYPVMYMDPPKKLTVYMAPGHDDTLIEQLNSLDIPECDLDPEAEFRLVENSADLLEKILIRDGNRDDRIIQLYKAIICENVKEEWPQITTDNLLYFLDENEEYFIVWGFDNFMGEQLTVNLDDELYQSLKEDYLKHLEIPSNKYAEVNGAWIEERIEVEP